MVYGPWESGILDLQLDIIKKSVPRLTRVEQSRYESQ